MERRTHGCGRDGGLSGKDGWMQVPETVRGGCAGPSLSPQLSEGCGRRAAISRLAWSHSKKTNKQNANEKKAIENKVVGGGDLMSYSLNLLKPKYVPL